MSAPVIPASWTEILDNVHQALVQAGAEAARLGEALESAAGALPDAEARAAAWQQTLAGLGEQLGRLQNGPAAAQRVMAESEALLQQNKEALEQWLAAAEDLRRKLANPAPVSVS